MASPRFVASWLAAMLGRTELPGRDELAALRPATRVLIVGLAAWILLVGMVTFIAVASVEMSTMNLPAWFDPRGSASPATKARARAAFDNIVQRPLFSRVRQVPVAAPVALPPPPLPSPTIALDRRHHPEGRVHWRGSRQSVSGFNAKPARGVGAGRRRHRRLEGGCLEARRGLAGRPKREICGCPWLSGARSR